MVAYADAPHVVISQDGKTILAKAGGTDKTLFQDPDALRVLEWSMANHRITVVSKGRCDVFRPIFIPRRGISLVIDLEATIVLTNLGARNGAAERHWPVSVSHSPGSSE